MGVPKRKEKNMTITDAAPGDLPAVAHIINHYRQCTSHLWDRTPLTPADMATWLAAHRQPPYAALVAKEAGVLTGYASLSRFRPHAGYVPVAESSLYVAPAHTGKGCGIALMSALLGRAAQNGLSAVTAWIDSENRGSLRFHEKFGFYRVGTMKNVGILDGMARSVVILQYDVR